MPDCELLSTCLFFNDGMHEMSGMTELDKERYCKGDYTWCGRYMVFKALERERKKEQAPSDLFQGSLRLSK